VIRLQKPDAERTFQQIRDQNGSVRGKTWWLFLKETRDYFTHAAAPWLATDRRRRAEGIYDIAIMRKNIKDFAQVDEEQYFGIRADLVPAWAALRKTATELPALSRKDD
jgi:hypothetical protein